MCAIAGFVHLDGRPLRAGVDDPWLGAMGEAMHDRGPDDTQLMTWQNVGFVFKRLSIVDVAGGRQPITTADGRVSAMVNGEIYNHREIRATLAGRHALRTQSDSEVVPYLYLDHELRMFEAVNGIFAVALLDRQQRRLILGRDRAGVKPLFHYRSPDGKLLVFASELKGLFAHPDVPRRLDWRSAIAEWSLHDGAPRELPSGFEGIDRIPAATMLDVSLADGRCRTERYWQLPAPHRDAPVHPASHYADRYGELLADSVRLQLMSDVPYGVFLSGGVDSATVAALAARAGPLPTFSVLSRSTIGSGDAEAAHDVAAALGLPNHPVHLDERNLALRPEDWRSILWSCEYFMSGPEQLFKYYLHAFARQRYPALKVILLGQGSDEFNGGYISHALRNRRAWERGDWQRLDDTLRAGAAEHAARVAGFSDLDVHLMLSGVIDGAPMAGSATAARAANTWQRYTGRWRKNLDVHLWHEDRTAAAHGIESRVPFLDHRLLECLATIPEQHHAELFVDKQILRRVAARLLPASLANRPKGNFFYGRQQHHAFNMMYSLFARNHGELIDQAIAGSRRTGGPLDPDRFRAYFRDVGAYRTVGQMTRLCELANMGILADLAASASTSIRRSQLPVHDVDWDDWAATPAGRSALRLSKRRDLAGDLVVGFAAGTSLVEVKSGGAGVPGPGSTFLVLDDGRLTSAITSPAWSRFLAAVDGKRSIDAIAALAHIARDEVQVPLAAALDAGVLVDVEDVQEQMAPASALRASAASVETPGVPGVRHKAV